MGIRSSSPRTSMACGYKHKHNFKLPPSVSLPPYPKVSSTRQTQRLSFGSSSWQLYLLDSSHSTTISLHTAYSFKLPPRCPESNPAETATSKRSRWRSLSTSTPSPNDSYLGDVLLKEFHIISLHPPIPKHTPHAGLNSSSIPCAPLNNRPKEEAAPKEAHVHMVELI